MIEPLKPVTVENLIEYLKTQPRDMLVVYGLYSEYKLLELKDIAVKKMQPHRNDGWVHTYPREQPETIEYLTFPGN
jgi:hypothetical protein